MVVDDETLSRKILRRFIEQTEHLSLLRECSSALEANKFLLDKEVDLIFLDVEMPGMTGLELIDILQKKPQIILVSGKKEYAVDAFDNDVVDYLYKPFSYPRFLKAVQKAYIMHKDSSRQKEKGDPDYIFLKVDSNWIKLKLEDIMYVQALADYVSIYARVNDEIRRYVIHSTMKGVESKLNADFFLRVHRSYIINLRNITSFSSESVTIADHKIPVGITYKNKIQPYFDKMH
jgi:DNA-binding LytR/AlgR family response regulator